MKVCVIGCGYVGLISAVGLASVGHHVTGIEIDSQRLAQLQAGHPPFYEPGLTDRLIDSRADGTLRFSSLLSEASDADIVLLAVPTPPRADGSNDLSAIEAVATELAQVFGASSVEERQVVVVRSTVVPGTTDSVIAPLVAGAAPGRLAVASNPEFLREGSAMADFLKPDRVVIGAHEPWAADRLRALYAPLTTEVVCTTPATAELAKYTSNALLATLISFSNEIARVAEATPDVDVEDVLAAVHLDRRLQPRGHDGQRLEPGVLSYLKAGCGYGGSCLPKDVAALIAYARDVGEAPGLLEAVRAVNDGQPERLVQMVERALGHLKDRNVAVLGVAFKAGTEDLRVSSGIEIARRLQARGAHVMVYDPLVTPTALEAIGLRAPLTDVLDQAVGSAEAVVVTSAAPEIQALAAVVADHADPPLVIDGRRHLSPEAFPVKQYIAIGRASALSSRAAVPPMAAGHIYKVL